MRAFADVAESGRELEAQHTYDAAQGCRHLLVGRRDERSELVLQVLGFVTQVRDVLDNVHSFTELFGARAQR
jgi:hypothetical protein